MNKDIAFFLVAHLIGTTVVWLQVNGQLVWKSFANNMYLLAALGMPISLIFMKATQWGYQGFDQKLWPLRLIGFALGMVTFTLLTWSVMGEAPTLKDLVCLVLAVAIVLIQLFL
jgi:hypothetical protein